jgi:hypothetical protein
MVVVVVVEIDFVVEIVVAFAAEFVDVVVVDDVTVVDNELENQTI